MRVTPLLLLLFPTGAIATGGNYLGVFNNAKLTVLEGLDSLTHIGGDLRLENNPRISDTSPNPASNTLHLTGLPSWDARIRVFSDIWIRMMDADEWAAEVLR